MPVDVSARGPRTAAFGARLGRQARKLLTGLRMPEAELSVVVVSDRTMRRLNRTWRGKDRPTDVLAFALQEAPGAPRDHLGDVVISIDTARRQAKDLGHALGVEGDRLLVHGLLHLLGYDHERSPAEARRMQRRERTLARWLAA